MIVLEKLVVVISALTAFLVGGGVAFVTKFPQHSGMPDEAIQSQIKLNDWLDSRTVAGKRGQAPIVIPTKTRSKKGGPPPKPISQQELAKETKARKYDDYIETDGQNVPPDEAVPGIPWLRAQPGVKYYRPKKVPQILHTKLMHFQHAYDAAQAGGGEFVETNYGSAYNIKWVKPDSHLGQVAGLKPGDKILSVNGHKVENSFTAAKQLYEQLKDEKRFAVKVLRDQKPTVLSFTVK